ncbi:protein containing PAS domain S-box [Bellilinea caldifistulae]|uniref:HD domain-containing phosphohydrolase n=1 Tax=Bellilinea caldifistulae TaxID=360411 RepID=UPI000781ECC6|nr:HD domain-containing phosphohydrolase [Bellilinea caldifistulae]GAP09723.1 protein containing PAS domain S-box [Bellilinea caldifistulae]
MIPRFRSNTFRSTALTHWRQKTGQRAAARLPAPNLLEILLDGYCVLDENGCIQHTNPALENLLACPAQQLTGSPLIQFIEPVCQTDYVSLLELMKYSRSRMGPLEIEMKSAAGEPLSVFLTLAPYPNGSREMIQVLLRDVSQWRQVQNELVAVNLMLEQSFTDTLEGWAKALELRDYETHGHTQRVAETTVQLALEVGFCLEEVLNVRHGALLHDIGKMAISDTILLKPGPLDETEWEIMRRHPAYAEQLLRQIDYLRPAIPIPYCHHEKWDGSGYPRGLKGEQIPLEARIFAVIDVYDALRSSRPYRPEPWSEERTLEYIHKQAGTHFDPDVVRVFLKMKNFG